MSQLPQPGQPAPQFSAVDQDSNPVSLSDLLGQWLVLYFYPKDDTPGCTTEAQEFTHYSKDFQQQGASIVGVSTDSPRTHARFRDKYSLTIRLLSDPEHQIAEAFGVWQLKKFMGREFMGVVRSTFLIAPDGHIAYTWPKVKAKGHAQAVLKQLQAIKASP